MSPKRFTPALSRTLRDWLRRPTTRGLLAVGGATALAFMLAIGAGAAPSPVTQVSEVLGLGGERGAAVSQAAHDAKAEAKEAGENVGAAVSTAVCEALKNTDDLPEPARDAPGHVNQEERDCTHPSDAEDSEDEAVADEEEASQDETEAEIQSEHENRGALVSQAAHDAKTEARENGENVGAAVSTAVCLVKQGGAGLPDGAQNAPGHQKDPKDCTHPSNADEDEEPEDGESEAEGTSQGHGKQSAPGQLKKQND